MRPSVMAGLGGGLLAAVLAGVTMGNAAVEGINPAAYRSPLPPRPKAAAPIDPPRDMLTRAPPSYNGPYGWDAGEMTRAVACGDDCKDDAGYSARVPYFNSREELAEAERAARHAIDRAFATESEAAMGRKEDNDRDPRGAGDKTEPGLFEDRIAVGDQR